MDINVQELDLSEYASWDQFVEESSESTFFHRAGWKTVLENGLGHRGYYLLAKSEGNIVGILPLVLMKSRIFGNTLSSVPFCAVGGVVASEKLVREALLDYACELAERHGVGSLEIRNRELSDRGWPVKELYVNFSKAISGDDDENMANIPRKQRAMVRQGIKKALVSEETKDWQRHYRVYSESVKNLGTPVFSKRYFRVLTETFGDECRMLMIQHEGQDIAAVMSYYFKDQVIPFYAGSLFQARKLAGNDFMYWELMRRSAQEGYRVFDFGRSKLNTGAYSFKKNWGFEPEQLHYEYFLVKDKSMPDKNPNNPKYKRFIETWRKLPLPVANTIGPLLSRTLG